MTDLLKMHLPLSFLSKFDKNLSIYDYIFNSESIFQNNETSWLNLFNFISLNLSYNNSMDIKQYLENFRVFLLQTTFNNDINDPNFKPSFISTFTHFFDNLYNKISLEILDNNNELLFKQLLYLFTTLYFCEIQPFIENESLFQKLKNLLIIFADMREKSNSKFVNLYSLIILVIKRIYYKIIQSKQEEEFQFEKYEIDYNSSQSQNSKNSINDNTISFKVDEQENILSQIDSPLQNLPKQENSNKNTSFHLLNFPEAPHIDNIKTSIGCIANQFYEYHKKNLVAYDYLFFTTQKYRMLSIGSNALGLNYSNPYRDFILYPRHKKLKKLSLAEINSFLSSKMKIYKFQEHRLTYEHKEKGKLSFICYNLSRINYYFLTEVYIGNFLYLKTNNFLKTIFAKNSNLAKVHVFYQKIFEVMGIKKRSDLSFLLIAYFDFAYDLFIRDKKCIKIFTMPKYNQNEHEYEFVEEHYYNFKYKMKKLNFLQNIVGMKQLIVNFIDFILTLVTLEKSIRMKTFPNYLFDEKYLFNINRVLAQLEEVKSLNCLFTRQMDNIKSKMQLDDFCYYTQLISSLHLKIY